MKWTDAETMALAIEEICATHEACDLCPLNNAVKGICGFSTVNWVQVLDITRDFLEKRR